MEFIWAMGPPRGVETCGEPMDLCTLAAELYEMGIDIHIISFIVKGMEDSELAYTVYNCMTSYSAGSVFQYQADKETKHYYSGQPYHDEKLLLPPMTFGKNLKGIVHFEVNLSKYMNNSR